MKILIFVKFLVSLKFNVFQVRLENALYTLLLEYPSGISADTNVVSVNAVQCQDPQ